MLGWGGGVGQLHTKRPAALSERPALHLRGIVSRGRITAGHGWRRGNELFLRKLLCVFALGKFVSVPPRTPPDPIVKRQRATNSHPETTPTFGPPLVGVELG